MSRVPAPPPSTASSPSIRPSDFEPSSRLRHPARRRRRHWEFRCACRLRPRRCSVCLPFDPEHIRKFEERLQRITGRFERLAAQDRLREEAAGGRVQ